jgi:hypothetical protein
VFETDRDVLNWYEAQPRAINREFLGGINWKEIQNYPLNREFLSVLLYMRDIESFTELYYRELLRTPTGKDPVIRKFMDRWNEEEAEHGQLLNRFLNEAGVETSADWRLEAKSKIPLRYTVEYFITPYITNLFGRYFTGAHMVWGTINEFTTLQAYRRLWQLAGHPVLEQLLRGIAQEESIHAKFYWSIARLELKRSRPSSLIARFIINSYWKPVGHGTKPQAEEDFIIATLFGGAEGVDFFDRGVNQRLEQLPGFAGNKIPTERIAGVTM